MARAAKAPAKPLRTTGWSVYLLRCSDGTLYAGATTDITRRLGDHGRGRVKYTRGRLPVALAFHEIVGEHGPALRREAALKRLTRARKEALVAGYEGSSGTWSGSAAGGSER